MADIYVKVVIQLTKKWIVNTMYTEKLRTLGTEKIKLITVFTFVTLVAFSGTVVAQRSYKMLNLLKDGKTQLLEKSLDKNQLEYDTGKINDIELRNVYRQFYYLDNTALKNLNIWIKSSPKTYSARLIRGVYYKKLGKNARGEKYISQTKQEQIQAMELLFSEARRDLTDSLKLTTKPLLSVFHLLDICGTEGDARCMSRLISLGDHEMPSNILLRCIYIHFLTPRWGGSYGSMKAFIVQTDKQLSDPIMHARLEAILEDDMGRVALERGETTVAIKHYKRALTLADKVGGDFRDDWLIFSQYAVRNLPELIKFRRN